MGKVNKRTKQVKNRKREECLIIVLLRRGEPVS